MQKGFPRPSGIMAGMTQEKDYYEGRFSDGEINVLFQHLRELNMVQENHDEEEWKELQAQLCHRGVLITVFTDESEYRPQKRDPLLYSLYRQLWAKDRVSRHRIVWEVFNTQLRKRGIFL